MNAKEQIAKNPSFLASEEMLDRALRSIPLASQTFSKSITQWPRGVSPFFIERGKGSHVWDVDGNEYVDFVNGLAAVTLGYCDPDVDSAVVEQMKAGVIFSLPHRLEMEVAERLIDVVPSAEMVRFGKNGSDATAGAVRVARAFTGRDHVAVCGYFGWQDWFIGSTSRNLGVPKATRELSHKWTYNDISSLDRVLASRSGEFAAVIMEPMNLEEPTQGFLESVKELTHRHGALLIFDETVTGFRFDIGGAQAVFKTTPDLSTFGKGMANGFPISAVVGRADVMKMMEEVFFSFTNGGETLSLAAAAATIDKLCNQDGIGRLNRMGRKVLDQLNGLIVDTDIGDVFATSGNPTWSFLTIAEPDGVRSLQTKTLFMQEMIRRGILSLGSHNMSFSHSESDVKKLIAAYSEVLPFVAESVRSGNVLSRLHCDPLQPLFQIR